jgi:plasmid stabilization system protein ParE
MAEIVYSETALIDLERLTEFLLEEFPTEAIETVDLITGAIELLNNHPLVGRPLDDELHELVISRGRSGYLAMYSLAENDEVVLILRIRHQRESGYG